jgi:hypothetical protein
MAESARDLFEHLQLNILREKWHSEEREERTGKGTVRTLNRDALPLFLDALLMMDRKVFMIDAYIHLNGVSLHQYDHPFHRMWTTSFMEIAIDRRIDHHEYLLVHCSDYELLMVPLQISKGCFFLRIDVEHLTIDPPPFEKINVPDYEPPLSFYFAAACGDQVFMFTKNARHVRVLDTNSLRLSPPKDTVGFPEIYWDRMYMFNCIIAAKTGEDIVVYFLIGNGTFEEDGARTVYMKYTHSTQIFSDIRKPPQNLDNLRFACVLRFGGNILLTGGRNNMSTEFYKECCEYNPVTDSWTPAPSMNIGRAYHAISLLWNGDVMVIGGEIDTGGMTRTCEILDTQKNKWVMAPPHYERQFSQPVAAVMYQ